MRGAAGQASTIVSRIVVQLAMAGVLLPAWGLQLYGEWLTIVGIALFAGASDLGFLTAAATDMSISAGRGDHAHARDTFRTVSRWLGLTFVAAVVVVFGLATQAPLTDWIGLEQIDRSTAIAILTMMAAQSMVLMFCVLFAAGYAADGKYGEAFAMLSGIYLLEWVAAGVAAVAGFGPLIATAALLGVRLLGALTMYLHMRRRVIWLSLGRPSQRVHLRKRLTGPALAGAAMGWGTAASLQAMVVLVGVVAGPANAAIFATVRAISRVVIQLASAVGPMVGPEFALAFGAGDGALIRSLHTRVTQLGTWSAIGMVALLAVFGDWIVSAITRGHVSVQGPLLLLLLAGAVLEVVWRTSGAVLFATNRHQRVGVIFTVVSVATLGLAYVLVKGWGVDGAAVSVVLLSAIMLVVMVPIALAAAGISLGAWVRSLVDLRDLPRVVTSLRPKR